MQLSNYMNKSCFFFMGEWWGAIERSPPDYAPDDGAADDKLVFAKINFWQTLLLADSRVDS